jgi:hypothetical protein
LTDEGTKIFSNFIEKVKKYEKNNWGSYIW